MTRESFIDPARAWCAPMAVALCAFVSGMTVSNVARAQQTTTTAVVDTGMTVVTLTPGNGRTLAAAVKTEVHKAWAQGRTPFVELGAEWCAPCQELKALLEPPVDSGIADIFAGTYVIRFDIDKWNDQEEKTLGLVSPRGIPAFLAIDTNGVATAIMPGDEWGDNNVSGLQPLKQFFRQHLRHGKDENTASPKKYPSDASAKPRSSTCVSTFYDAPPVTASPYEVPPAHTQAHTQAHTRLEFTLTAGRGRDTVSTDTVTAPISTALLDRWLMLHTALSALPDSVRVTAPTHYVASFGGKGEVTQLFLPLQDFGSLAATHAEVAAAFTRTGISPRDYFTLASQFVRPLLLKHMRELLVDKIAGRTPPPGWPHTPPDTTLEQNLAVVGPAESRLAAAGFVLPLPADKLETTGPGIGDRIPDLTATYWLNPTKDHVASGAVSLGDGHVYVLAFSAPWCALCPATYGPVATVAAHYADRNVRTYVVTSGERDELAAYYQRHNVTLPILVEPSAADNPSMIQDWERLSLQTLPTILLVDATGIIRYRVTGSYGNATALTSILAAGLDTLLAEKRVETKNAADGTPSRASSGSASGSASVISVPFDDVQGLTMVNAEVEGHRGRFVIDLATPVVLVNRAHLQPTTSGGLDTVRVPVDSAAIDAARTGPSWAPSQVSVRIGDHTIRVSESAVPMFPMVGMQYDLSPVERYLDTQFLGLIGIPAVLDYETIIDFSHRRLTLVPVDSAGHRLAAMPDYTPRSSVPILFDPKRAHWYVVGSVGGLPDTLQLDTGNNRNELNAKTQANIASHVKATGRTKLQDGKREPEVMLDTLTVGDRTYTNVPFYVSDAVTGREDTLGNSFFSTFGVIGFNMRAQRMLFYK